MVIEDANDVARMTFALQRSRTSGILGLGLAPIVCFFVVESYDWLREHHALPANPFLEEQGARVRSIRARLKLVSADGGFHHVLQQLQHIESASFHIFHSAHRGLLARLKHWLQDDLGMYYLGPDLICTNHVALINMGYDASALAKFDHHALSTMGPELLAFSENLGEFVGGLLSLFDTRVSEENIPSIQLKIEAEDHKSRTAYRLIEEKLQLSNPRIAAPFTWIASQVNYTHRALRAVLPPDSAFFFRIRFLAVYYLARAFLTLGALLRGERQTVIGRLVATVQSRDGIRRIRKMERLRDSLAHYDSAGLIATGEHPMNVLVKQRSGITRKDLSKLLDDELEACSVHFRMLLTRNGLGRRLDALRE